MMLMSNRNVNKTSMHTCCKGCLYGNGGKNGRKINRRYIKRSERNKWKRDYSL